MPARARRGKLLAARGEEWFWHTLALALGGRTVAEWKGVMTLDEFAAWVEYFRLQPFDDLHRYHRPAALVSSAWGGKLEERLDWLTHPLRPPAGYSQADLTTMKALGFKPPAHKRKD